MMKKYLIVQFIMSVLSLPLMAQEKADSVLIDTIIGSLADSAYHVPLLTDSLPQTISLDSITEPLEDMGVPVVVKDAAVDSVTIPSVKKPWMPNPKRALWLAIAIPGGGQIYNRKYWKLPIIYGGFIGCIYALNWNGNMYRDYSLAYAHICDNDPATKSYENFIPAGYDVEKRKDYLTSVFKRKKDFYRRYRDLSLFCMIGVYALSVIDAYIDAELSSFDISRDLTLRVTPAVISDYNRRLPMTGYNGTSYGMNVSLTF